MARAFELKPRLIPPLINDRSSSGESLMALLVDLQTHKLRIDPADPLVPVENIPIPIIVVQNCQALLHEFI